MKEKSQKKWLYIFLVIIEIAGIIFVGYLLYNKYISADEKEKKIKYYDATEVATTEPEVTTSPEYTTSPYTTTEDKPLVLDYELVRSGYMNETDMERQDIKQYTIMIYLNGSNLETYLSCASEDLQEMMHSRYDDDNLNVLIFTGGTKEWQDFDIPSKTSCIYLLKDNELELLADVGRKNMCEPDTLSKFVDFGMELFPAQRSGLILWNHGGGAVEGYGYDEYHEEDALTLVELEEALKNSSASKRKLEFIGFDACLMATIETADAVQDYSKYLIASEEIEPQEGWDYSFLYDISKKDDCKGNEIGQLIVDSYSDYYEENLPYLSTTLSVMDLGRVDETVNALNKLSRKINYDINNGEYNTIAKNRNEVKEFGNDSSDEYTMDMIDLYNLAEEMSDQYTRECNIVINSINNLVIYNKTSGYIDDSNGVSIYFPYTNKESVGERLPVYSEIDFSPAYKQLVTDFSEVLTGDNFNEYNYEDLAPVELDEGEIELYLSIGQINSISEINFILWQQSKDDEDYYIKLGQNSNVEIENDGRISTGFNGVWTAIQDEWICMYELEKAESYQKYSVPVLLNDEECDMIVIFSDINPDGKILGCYPVESETNMADKNLIEIEKGDTLQFIYYAELFLPYDELQNDTRPAQKTMYSEEIKVGNKLVLESKHVRDGVYLYGFEFLDTQNTQHSTQLIQVDYN